MNRGEQPPTSSQQAEVEPTHHTASSDAVGATSGERLFARRSLLIGGLVAVAAPIGVSALVGRQATTEIAPEFTVEDLADENNGVSLAGRAGSPALVNFWASWCVPCRTEMPVLEAGFMRFGSRVQFIGVDHQDNRTAAQAFVTTAGVRYRSGFDPDGTVAATYNIRGLPTTVLVGANGRRVETVTGALTAARLEQLLSDRLGIR